MTKKEDDFDLLFEELPTKNGKPKAIKPAKSPFGGDSSLSLLGELFRRHSVDVQAGLFWVLLVVVLWTLIK